MVRRQHEAEEREAKWKIEEAQKRSARQLLSFELEEARRLRLAQYKESLQEKQLNMTIMRIQKENRIAERNAMEKQLHKEMDRRVVSLKYLYFYRILLLRESFTIRFKGLNVNLYLTLYRKLHGLNINMNSNN